MKTILLIGLFFAAPCVLFSQQQQEQQQQNRQPIKHRFLAFDESRFQFLSIDQFEPEKSWVIPVPQGCMDMRVLADNRILTGLRTGGFLEIDRDKKAIICDQSNPKFAGHSGTAERLSDGRTLLSICKDDAPNEFILFDRQGKETSRFSYPDLNRVRCTRITPRDTILFGSNGDRIFEGTLDGKIIRDISVPGSNYNYVCIEKPNGNIVTAGGFSCFLAELDKNGKVVKKWGEKPIVNGLPCHFYASLQLLKNGNVVVANWTGHGAKDSEKGVQILEIDPSGQVVWFWHDSKQAGSINEVFVLE